MHAHWKRPLLLAAGLWLVCASAQAQVVISQVYGGGGNSGATLRSDFIELHNNGSTTVSLAGWSVQYASSTGTSWNRTNLSGSIAPGGYFLIKQADGTGGTVSLPTPDITGTIPMSGTAGKVALVSNQTNLTGACPLGGAVVDFIGFGSATNCAEGSPTANLSNTTAAIRAANGCTDNGNNSADFSIAAPNPRNSAAPAAACGAPALSIADADIEEGNSGSQLLRFTLSLNGPATSALAIRVQSQDLSANAGSDYTAFDQTVSIAAGASSATLDVEVLGDVNVEGDETFQLTISGYPNITDATAVGTIRNDDAVLPDLSVADVSVLEGQAGSSSMNFTVALSAPAGATGVSFRARTQDGTATTADNDYVAVDALIDIPAGATFVVVPVTINADARFEGNETFRLVLSEVNRANLADGEAQGSIQNDDYLAIHEIQGDGRRSAWSGRFVLTQGIVTARTTRGFFLQTADTEADADAATSQGIYVFTGSAPSSLAAIGNRVEVGGNLVEFSATSLLPLTEITGPTLRLISSGNALPTPITLSAAEINAGATLDAMERYESMRVRADTLKVVAPNGANIRESSATVSNPLGDGVFWTVLDGVARPFREAGIPEVDGYVAEAGKTLPRFDANPERIRIRSNGQAGGGLIRTDVGDRIDGMTGVLDFFDWYTLIPDVDSPHVITRGAQLRAVSDRSHDQFTVGGFNLLRFFDSVNDPGVGEPVLTAAALDNRLRKTGNAICAYTKNPDILGVVEVENLAVLQQLADTINQGGSNQMFPGACLDNPNYQAVLLEGNDIGGIDVGFLVRSQAINGGKTRVQVVSVTQIGKDSLFTNADGSTELLNDRPSLKLKAIVHDDDGGSVPVTVYANHLRSLNGIVDHIPGSSGWSTVSARVRAKRAQQALELAQDVQAEQTVDPNQRIVMVGDFNAFEFNDGYVDSMGIITGRATPQAQVATYAASPVSTPLSIVKDETAAGQSYSFAFEGNAQSLDHVVVNQAVLDRSLDVRAEHARLNADFGEDLFGDYTVPARVSDHDPVVLFVTAPELRANVDLYALVAADDNDIMPAHTPMWGIEVGNLNGERAAQTVDLILTLNTAAAGVSIDAPQWQCVLGEDTATRSSWLCTHIGPMTPNSSEQILVTKQRNFAHSGKTLTLEAIIGGLDSYDVAPANNSDADSISVWAFPNPPPPHAGPRK